MAAIRSGQPFNEAENTAISTMAGIMGRISSYTGKLVSWEKMMNLYLKLGPKVFESMVGFAELAGSVGFAELKVPRSLLRGESIRAC